MDTLWGLIVLVATLLSQEVVTGLGGAEPGFNVGCRFAEGLCDENAEEECYDDNVFGRCLPSNLQFEGSHKFLHMFKLSPEDVAGLQWTLKHLDSLGYTWTDFYTQCILQVLLEGFRTRQILDLSVCKEFEESEVNLDLLKQLVENAGKPDLSVKKPDGADPPRQDSPIIYADEIYYPPVNDLDQLEVEREIKNLPYGRKNKEFPEGFDQNPGKNMKLTEFYAEGETPSRRQKHKLDSQSEAEIFQNYMLRPDDIQPSKVKRSRFEPADEEDQVYQLSPDDIRVLEELAVAENKELSEDQDGEATEEEPEETEEEILEIPANAILRNPTFLRQERLDVKKPGPHYRVNNFAFDDLEERLNEEDRRTLNSRRERTLFGNHRVHPKTHRRVLPVLQEENDAWISEDDYEFEPNRGLYWPRWNYNEMNPDAGLDEAVRIEEILEKMAHERNDLPNEIQPGMVDGHPERLEEPTKEQVSTIPSVDSLTPSNTDEKKKLASAGFSRLAALQGLNVHEARRSEMNRLGMTTVEALTTVDDDLERYNVVDTDYVFLVVKERFKTWKQGAMVVKLLADLLQVPHATFSDVRVDDSLVTFRVLPNRSGLNASYVAASADEFKDKILERNGASITATGIGDTAQVTSLSYASTDKQLLAWSIGLCATVAAALTAAGVLYLIRKGSAARKKLAAMGKADAEASEDYKDLCRARMSKPGTKVSSHPAFHGKDSEATPLIKQHRDSESNRSSRSSTSSWCEEPITSNIDISTGHMVLAYMEDHLRNRDRLEQEWETLCGYEADPNSTTVASKAENAPKNRVPDVLPYDHNRVVLSELANASGSDYINASTITDHDPRNPAYIATQGPLPMTVTDFWQLVWEQGSVVLVLLTRLSEHGEQLCYRYWPEEGSQTFHIYEVHLVSEHIWCDDYLVRSFYLKNLRTGETRTVTQFHFLSWTGGGIPISAKSLLEFRRKVNKSYRGRSCPIIVHCSDGAGRTGTYCLIDMVLNRISKGAKEIDIAATLEHLRDQRIGMVRTRQQFEFVLKAVAEEVHAILRALPQ